jgi:hypothetical protein
MEWIKDYWYIIIPVLLAAMFIFGHGKTGSQEEKLQDDQPENHSNKSGHGCCH